MAANDVFDVSLEPRKGLIICATRGFWSIEQIDAYFGLLSQLCAAARTRFGRVRVLSDGRQSIVQTPDVAAKFSTLKQLLCGSEDRFALLVASNP